MTERAWVTYDDNANETVIDWLRRGSGWASRAFLIPQKRWSDPILDDYAKNGNVGSDKGNQAQSGGPVFCLGPTLKLLEQAVHVAGENRLGIVEWSAPLIRGWAAATGAVNLATGAIEPTPNDEAQAALEELARIGFLRPEPFYKAKRVEPVATLKNAGCDLYYVQTYLIAQGLTHTDVAGAAKYFDRPPTNWDV